MGDIQNTVYRYHDETKHRPHRYARSLGFLDWATQPDPFLRLAGAPLAALPAPSPDPDPAWDLVPAGALPPAPLNPSTVSRLLMTSLALAAWKQVDGPDGRVLSRWALRVNPSSGNLHPTEGWLAAGPDAGLADGPALFHYRPDAHALERCRDLAPHAWAEAPGAGRLLLALSSIAWREAWKYGERAYRYCSHDVGHALAAVDLAAAALGWSAQLVTEPDDEALGAFLGCDRREGPEADHPDLLLVIDTTGRPAPAATPDLAALAAGGPWQGRAEPLSGAHQTWPIIDEVREAARWPGGPSAPRGACAPAAPTELRTPRFTALVRGRRSAVSMDGRTSMSAEAFFGLMGRLLPGGAPRPFGVLPWAPAVSLVLFVHRVDGLAPGLYALVRDPGHLDPLKAALRPSAMWASVPGAPADLPLFQLGAGDVRAVARDLSCHQDIAADGAFAAAMLARFAPVIEAGGAAMYARLFWECGAIGQMLYLEAEAAGVQGTGIGCFFDDEVHRLLGLEGMDWQSLYHFTVGGGVPDARVRSEAAYRHLAGF
ncbi:MAG TPA: SagB/ThcOx family dehydrogenase [Candidatus Krumholzibacteria bacterium]|nr:SagB/ThcOx family dehydrogenase [Candidatus Krumholzibacteria bacterium]